MPSTRLAAIDLARGLALLGVALVNVHAFAVGWDSHRALERVGHLADLFAELLIGFFVQGRAYPTLAFLFGLGLALQWARAEAAEPESARAVLSAMRARLVALWLLGVAHGLLLWPGDIVSSYALIGLALCLRWPRAAEELRLWVVTGAGLFLLLGALSALWFVREPGDPLPPEPTSVASASLAAALAAHPLEFLRYGLIHLIQPQLWALAAAGVWLAPRLIDWLKRGAPWNRSLSAALAVFVLGLLCDALALVAGQWTYSVQQQPATAWLVLAQLAAAVGSAPLLLWLAARWARPRAGSPASLRWLVEAAGRAPLTQFFGQSLVFALVFAAWAGGWHGELGRAAYSALALTTWAVLAALSAVWFARGYARAPVETLWLALARWLAQRR
ncbi:MAG: DUF418 domain-containing protein [Casimicrobiaceae bacterium]|nr:DUF418 domain-containing protein [Casimicrobiaceae bacterium]MCX8098999.1 DUF418 domain-containing protein [Casimicrobiaceae bacterium]MDW8311473.1 DUF418 domain-containing protein [Burkholderiales bacterium]